MKRRPTAAKALVSLTAALALALAGTAVAHHGGWGNGHDDPAGTVASFDEESGILTIDLADGGSVSGAVTRWTWIDCGHHHWDRHRGRGLFHHGSDDSGEEWKHHSRCSGDLIAGATVDDALVGLRDGGAFFLKVDLEEEDESSDD